VKHTTLLNQLTVLALTLTLGLSLIGLLRDVGAQGMQPQDTLSNAFTYQGKLLKDGNAITGACDFQFSLWDAASDGDQVGSTQTIGNVSVADGYFAVSLNSGGEFGSNAFTGDARYLQIAAQCTGDGDFVTLSGRVALTAAPYALYATSAPWNGLKSMPAGFADGVDDAGPDYQNVIVVAKSGGDFTSVQAALDSIGDNSATNRYLVWVAPGTYTETVTMKPYVDIQGAGELATKITAAGSASPGTGTVVGADNAELRFLTVENTGGNTYAIAIYNHSASPRLTHLTAIASGIDEGHGYGVYNDASSPTMTNMTAAATGVVTQMDDNECYGVYNDASSSPLMENVTVIAEGSDGYGVYNNSSSPTMRDVTVTIFAVSGYGVYNNSCSPEMIDVIIEVSGYGLGAGVFNDSSSPTMTNVTISPCGDGVRNRNNSAPEMTNVTIKSWGTPWGNFGVYNDSSSSKMTDVTIINDGQDYGYGGVYNTGTAGTVTIDHSTIAGNIGQSIHNDSAYTVRVGASQLKRAASGTGTFTCVNTYDDSYQPLNANCQ
jgi:hypothetical protein